MIEFLKSWSFFLFIGSYFLVFFIYLVKKQSDIENKYPDEPDYEITLKPRALFYYKSISHPELRKIHRNFEIVRTIYFMCLLLVVYVHSHFYQFLLHIESQLQSQTIPSLN